MSSLFFLPSLHLPPKKIHPSLPESCQLKGLFSHQTTGNFSKASVVFTPFWGVGVSLEHPLIHASRFGKFGVPTVGCLGSPPKFQFGELRSPFCSERVVLLMATRNPARKPVEVGRIYHYLQGFIHPNGGWPWDFRTINSMGHGFFSWWVPRKTLSQMKEKGFFKTSDDACAPYLLRRCGQF